MKAVASYEDQVKLLLDVLPLIQNYPSLALKGGTAINLFYRNMPRLSVDIDLTYLPIEPRDIFLHNLEQILQDLEKKITQTGLQVKSTRLDGRITKLLVSDDRATIKIEPNTVLRGTVFEPSILELTQSAQDQFFQYQTAKVVSLADLYGGKICAALDRQHPRDLFDIKLLFENEGFTTTIRRAFIAYLASSPRPMSELIDPHELDMRDIFQKEFLGMTILDISYDELCQVRKSLIKTMRSSLLSNEKEFLISIKKGTPDWSLMGIEGLDKLPGIQWKLKNIARMPPNTKSAALAKLEKALDI